MVNESDRETTEQIRARLSAGEIIEVAGYPLTSALADSLSSRRMSEFSGLSRMQISWIEVVSKPDQPLSIPSRKLIDALQAQGTIIRTATVACPMIWQLHERADAPELLNATLKLLVAEQ